MATKPKMTTQQISDLHASLVDVLGIGIDPANVRHAVERAGWVWDLTCEHDVLRRIKYEDEWHYICATDANPGCHEKFKVLGSSSDALGIEELGLSVRAYNVLKREGVNTVGELCRLAWYDLADMRNMGIKAVADVEEKLQSIGRSLKESWPNG